MRIGVDIGGTFTDLVLIDENSGTVPLGKLLTTPDNPTRAVMDGITQLLHDAGSGGWGRAARWSTGPRWSPTR